MNNFDFFYPTKIEFNENFIEKNTRISSIFSVIRRLIS